MTLVQASAAAIQVLFKHLQSHLTAPGGVLADGEIAIVQQADLAAFLDARMTPGAAICVYHVSLDRAYKTREKDDRLPVILHCALFPRAADALVEQNILVSVIETLERFPVIGETPPVRVYADAGTVKELPQRAALLVGSPVPCCFFEVHTQSGPAASGE